MNDFERIADLEQMRKFGAWQAKKRIIAQIESRVIDLRSCGKQDNCRELADLIESYIPEWTEKADR